MRSRRVEGSVNKRKKEENLIVRGDHCSASPSSQQLLLLVDRNTQREPLSV